MVRKGKELRPVMTRIPEALRRRLEREAELNRRSMNAEIIDRLEQSFQGGDIAKIIKDALAAYLTPLTEIGLFDPEYARTRWRASDLVRLSQEAGLTPTENFRRLLEERGINPDAPYELPAGTSEQDEVVLPAGNEVVLPAGNEVVLPAGIFHKKKTGTG